MNTRSLAAASIKTMAVMPFAHIGIDPTLTNSANDTRFANDAVSNRFPVLIPIQNLINRENSPPARSKKKIAYLSRVSERENRGRSKSTVEDNARTRSNSLMEEINDHNSSDNSAAMWHNINDEYVPTEIWNHVVSKHVPTDLLKHPSHEAQSTNIGSMPFGLDRSRHYVNSTLRKLMSKAYEVQQRSASVPLLPHRNTKQGAIYDVIEGSCIRPDAPPTRVEAMLLKEAYEEMTANIRSPYGGNDPLALTQSAARNADSNRLLHLMEPEFYVLDVTLTELVNQVRVSCQERGNLLETCRVRMLDIFNASSDAIKELGNCHEHQIDANKSLQERIGPLEKEVELANKQIAYLTDELARLQNEIEALKGNLEKAEKQASMNSDGQFISKSQREKSLEEQLNSAEQLIELMRSKIIVLESEQNQNKATQEVLRLQILQLQDRVRRDAEKFDLLKETIARMKLAQFWLRTMAFLRRAPKNTKEQSTQDGDGVDSHKSSDSKNDKPQTPLEERKRREAQALKNRVISRETFVGQVIAYSAFWGSVVKQAENVDFAAKPKLQMTKNSLLEFISKIYMEKILFDEIDDRTRLPRQTLPEFLYVYHLEVFGEPQLAYEALVNIIANVRTYDRSSLRIKMFSRFLNLGGQPFPLEALNIYLVSLVKLQNGQVPLLADMDGIQVESARALRVVEYIFAQAPAVVRAKVMQGAEKLSSGRSVDVDSFLLFIIENWKEEAGRAEERLRALFVASDADGDGNLDITEFTQMVDHVNVGKGHRELMRMYAEMTLDQQVDCNTFVRVCRKFRFFTFEVGPAVKKTDQGMLEIFTLLAAEWKKMEEVVHEILVVLHGTPVGKRLAQLVTALKKMLSEKIEVEMAWLMFRNVVAGFMSAAKKQAPLRVHEH